MRISVLFLMVSAALAQTPGFIMSGSGELSSGIVVQFRTMVEPPDKVPGLSAFNGGVRDGENVVRRYMWNNSIYFGYEIGVTRVAAGGYAVTFLPLSVLPRWVSDKSLAAAPQPVFPPPQTVQDGDTIALDMFVSADGKHKIVDYLQILSREKSEPLAAFNTAEPRDFTPDDGAVHFEISPKVTYWINGKRFEGEAGFTGKGGATLWVYFPGQPRYILSLVPAAGFEKAGTVRDHVVAFSADGQQYEIRFSGPIAGKGGAFNLYLMRDFSYRPRPERTNAVACGSDRLDNLVSKR